MSRAALLVAIGMAVLWPRPSHLVSSLATIDHDIASTAPHHNTSHMSDRRHFFIAKHAGNPDLMSRHVRAAGGTVLEHFDSNSAYLLSVPAGRSHALFASLHSLPGIPTTLTHVNMTWPKGLPPKVFPPQPRRRTPPEPLAICVMVHDQHADLREWLEHYLRLGASRVYLFDHGSNPPLLDTVLPFVRYGLVTYTWTPQALIDAASESVVMNRETGRKSAQWFVYNECVSRALLDRHDWLAFFDVDEFLLLKNSSVKDLPTFLRQYRQYGCLAVNWMGFGSSGHRVRPAGSSTLAAYWKCSRRRHVKAIVNTRYVSRPKFHPHNFLYKKGQYCVDERYRPVEDATTQRWTGSQVVLHHYVTKSWDEFQDKMRRGGGAGGRKTARFFNQTDAVAVDNCTDAVEWMRGRTWQPPWDPGPGATGRDEDAGGTRPLVGRDGRLTGESRGTGGPEEFSTGHEEPSVR